MYKSITISAIALCICVLSGCSEAECINHFNDENRKCETYNNMLLRCTSDSKSSPYLPNCDVVEYCTDYSAIERDTSINMDSSNSSDATTDSDSLVDTNSDTNSESDSESDSISDSETTTPTGIVCEYVCEGNLISCEDITDKNKCIRADHCEWYSESTGF